MKKIMLLVMLLAASCGVLAQRVNNARFVQEGRQVKIYYDLSEAADVSIYLSTDGGRSYESSPIGHVSGHVGQQVPAGSGLCAVWDVLADRDKLQGSQVCFKIRARRQGGNKTFTVGGVSFTMVKIEGGTFMMGAQSSSSSSSNYDRNADSYESPVHSVTLSSYYIGEMEVTQALWKAVMGSNPSYFKGDNLPVEGVSWEDICGKDGKGTDPNSFLYKLNRLTGRTFRLPTEAEWEYAARGGSSTSLYNGENIHIVGTKNSRNLDKLAWYGGNCGRNYTASAGCDVSKGYDISRWSEKLYDDSRGGTHPVGKKSPNAYGLYDMLGNVWEWCSDWYGSYNSGSQTNPKGPSKGSLRVVRGGSWINFARSCRVSYRNAFTPSSRINNGGLRLVLVS